MTNNIKGVFFDLDGVIINSSSLWDYIITTIVDKYALDTELLKENDGYNLSTEDAIRLILEKSNRFSPSLYSEITEHIEYLYALYFTEKTSLMDEIIDVLEWLMNNNIKLALVSNSSNTQVATILEYYELNKYFCQNIVTSTEVIQGKPHQEPYLKALEKSGLQKGEVLVVEDSLTGIASAKNAELEYILVDNKKSNKLMVDNISLWQYLKDRIVLQ